MEVLRILSIVFAIIALVGLVSVIAGTRNVNIGAFIFPAIFAVVFMIFYMRRNDD